jgi:hypothetical protein
MPRFPPPRPGMRFLCFPRTHWVGVKKQILFCYHSKTHLQMETEKMSSSNFLTSCVCVCVVYKHLNYWIRSLHLRPHIEKHTLPSSLLRGGSNSESKQTIVSLSSFTCAWSFIHLHLSSMLQQTSSDQLIMYWKKWTFIWMKILNDIAWNLNWIEFKLVWKSIQDWLR